MADAGVEPLEVVYVHALAAAEALAHAEIDAELHAASRIDELTRCARSGNTPHTARVAELIRLVDGPASTGRRTRLVAATGVGARSAHRRRETEE